MFNFETFDSKNAPPPSEPTVTFQTRGYISFNRGAYELLGKPSAVQLLYDREKKVVGFRPVAKTAENAVIVRKASTSATYMISATKFTKFINLKTTPSVRYPASKYEDILVVDVSKPGTNVERNRTKSDE